MKLTVEPAHPRWGLGFYYELRTTGAAITRVLAESPASRAGLKTGDELIELDGKPVAKMEGGDVQSQVNANAQVGIEMLVKPSKGDERRVTVKEGVVYPDRRTKASPSIELTASARTLPILAIVHCRAKILLAVPSCLVPRPGSRGPSRSSGPRSARVVTGRPYV